MDKAEKIFAKLAQSGTLTNTRNTRNAISHNKKTGKYTVKSTVDVSAAQVGSKGGRRTYEGKGSSRNLSMARTKARSRARFKMVSAPADSVHTSKMSKKDWKTRGYK